MRGPLRLAYLASGYPGVSHTFIQREVAALRATGVEIRTFTVRRTPADQLLSAQDHEEQRRTTAILPPVPRRLVAAHLLAATRAPGAYLATLRRALSLSSGTPRDVLWHAFYFVEAIVLWSHLRRSGLRHVHVHFANVGADVAMLATSYGRLADADPRWGWSLTMHGPTEFFDVEAHRLAEKVGDARLVVCISNFARSQLMGLTEAEHWDKLRIVHCGVDPASFAPAREATPAAGDGPLRVLCVGRLVAVKGQTVLLRAAHRLAAAGTPVALTFVGDGPSRAALEREAAALGVDARFLGSVGQDEIRAHYARADVFCLPSFAEGVPVVLMEAMAMELPVVSSRIAGIPELIEDGVGGLLTAPGDEEGLARALARLAADPAERRRLGRAGRAQVEREFALQGIAAELRDVFSAAVPDS